MHKIRILALDVSGGKCIVLSLCKKISINDFIEDMMLIRVKNIQHQCFRKFGLKMRSEKQLLAFPQEINSAENQFRVGSVNYL